MFRLKKGPRWSAISYADFSYFVLWRKEKNMAKKGVSGKTHTKQQLNNYANQHNPNNKAYKANVANQQATKLQSKTNSKYDVGILDGESYGWCDD